MRIPQGGYGYSTISSTQSGGFTGPIVVNETIIPRAYGLTLPGFNGTVLGGSASTTFSIYTQCDTPTGFHQVIFTGWGGSLTRTAVLNVTITSPGPSFCLNGPTNVTVASTDSVTVPISVESLGGFSAPVQLLYYPGPSYGGVDNPNPTLSSGQTLIVQLTVASSTYTNDFQAILTGEYANGTLQTRLEINVHLVPLVGLLGFNLTYVGNPVPGGQLTLHAAFSNLGTIFDRVDSVTIASDLGTYSFPVPFQLQPGTNGTISAQSSLSQLLAAGKHHVTATVYWSYLYQGMWRSAQNPIQVSGDVTISPVPSSPPGIIPSALAKTLNTLGPMLAYIAIGYVAFSIVLTVGWAKHESARQRRRGLAGPTLATAT